MAALGPPRALTGTRATDRTAVFDLRPDTDLEGTVELTGTFEVPDGSPGAPAIAIFEGPDTGWYRVAGDTLRLRLATRLSNWVGVIRFSRFLGGVIAGGSDNGCRSIAFRLERQP